MLSIKHGLMKMNGNILDGKNISNTEILSIKNPLGNTPAILSNCSKNHGYEDDNDRCHVCA